VLTLHVFREAGEAMAVARWQLVGAGVVVVGAWLGKRLGRYVASHHKP
jgi:hypothetical protein